MNRRWKRETKRRIWWIVENLKSDRSTNKEIDVTNSRWIESLEQLNLKMKDQQIKKYRDDGVDR
jgi:hypothetical protein